MASAVQQAIKQYVSTRTFTIKQAYTQQGLPIGFGIFSREFIPAGTVVFMIDPSLQVRYSERKWRTTMHLPPLGFNWETQQNAAIFVSGTGTGKNGQRVTDWLSAAHFTPHWYYMNHASEEGRFCNMQMLWERVCGKYTLIWVAKRGICIGEGFRFYYGGGCDEWGG